MNIDPKDIEKIGQLVGEGKLISKVWEEDFPQYDYEDIYEAAWSQGEMSALGVKRMISNRLKNFNLVPAEQQAQLLEEIDELVWRLYDRLRADQWKLQQIRKVLDE